MTTRQITNPVHTLIVLIDAEGNVEYKDIENDLEGFARSGDEVEFLTETSRTVFIGHLYPEPATESISGETPDRFSGNA